MRDNVTYLAVGVRGFSRTLRTYRFIQAVHGLNLRARFDIVHAITPCLAANVYQPRGGTYAETVARNLDLAASPIRRDLKWLGRRFNLRQSFLLRMEKTLLRKRRDQVFVAAVSEYVRRQVVDGYGLPPARTRVVFNGVDIAPLSPEEVADARAAVRAELRLAPEPPLVLFVAHNFKLKGLAELIRAGAYRIAAAAGDANSSSKIADAPWTLVVAGRDRPRAYQRLARQVGVADRVHFVGTQTPIRRWYAAADVLAHPTWYDPCSRVVLEALSVGLPVVTTRFNGAAEAMDPGRHGEVLDGPGDIPALAAGIARALHPAVRAACRADAARLHEQLSMARHARELAAWYETILAAGSNGRARR